MLLDLKRQLKHPWAKLGEVFDTCFYVFEIVLGNGSEKTKKQPWAKMGEVFDTFVLAF